MIASGIPRTLINRCKADFILIAASKQVCCKCQKVLQSRTEVCVYVHTKADWKAAVSHHEPLTGPSWLAYSIDRSWCDTFNEKGVCASSFEIIILYAQGASHNKTSERFSKGQNWHLAERGSYGMGELLFKMEIQNLFKKLTQRVFNDVLRSVLFNLLVGIKKYQKNWWIYWILKKYVCQSS